MLPGEIRKPSGHEDTACGLQALLL